MVRIKKTPNHVKLRGGTVKNMSTNYVHELVRDHTLTHVHIMENITNWRSLVRGACTHTGGGTKMRILVSHAALNRVAGGDVPLSIHLMAAAEGFLQQRHMLDHRYPRLTQLFGIPERIPEAATDRDDKKRGDWPRFG